MIFYSFLLRYNVDESWKPILERISVRDAPYGTFFQKDHLCYKKYTILIEPRPDIVKELIAFFTEHINLPALHTVTYESWRDIKKKYIRNHLIENFVKENRETYNLSSFQSQKLLTVIQMALLFRKLTFDDIEIEDGKIVTIRYLTFEEKDFNFEGGFIPENSKDSKAVKQAKISFAKLWTNYIKEIQSLA
jgi:hypothetical protein